MKRKVCPLLIYQETNQSMTVSGQSWTSTYMLECIGGKCAAYEHGFCQKFQCTVLIKPEQEG